MPDVSDRWAAAATYEDFMGRWSRQLAPALVAFSGVKDGEKVLDVGSGTGALSVAVLAASPSGSPVTLQVTGAVPPVTDSVRVP